MKARTVREDRTAAGILPDESIRALIAAGGIALPEGGAGAEVQPASLDLKLDGRAIRVRASFLPGPNRSVTERLADLTLHTFSLDEGAVLETGCVYIVPLQERLRLPDDISASANPKSSTGRLDVFVRVIADRAETFDQVPAGYRGPLFLEVSPRTFPVVVRRGSRLAQIRFRQGHASPDGTPGERDSIALSVDLERDGQRVIGWRAKRHTGVIDVDRAGAYDSLDFWEPIEARGRPELILDPDEFYILASRERVRVPPTHAAEMVPFDAAVGEFRVHYAGFFDPGFGHGPAGGEGSRAVLEVRSREVPFILEHGQTVGRLVYERMAGVPRTLYGAGLGSHYQAQGLKLSKHFRVQGADAPR